MTQDGCKVCRLRREYTLEGLDETLLERWQREEDREGYRQLATYVNACLLESELERAGLYTLDPAATALYERLVDGDTAVERNLRREEIPLEKLERDFVSYGVVRTHLTECLGEEWTAPDRDSDWERRTLEAVRSRLEERTAAAVRSLVEKGEIPAPRDTTVQITTTVRCPACDVTAPIETVLENEPLCSCVTADDEGAQSDRLE